MSGFSVLDFSVWEPAALKEHPAYPAGNALGWLYRGNKQAATNYPLVGRLYVAKSGWLLLSVPNALVRGVFDAMSVPGAELPLAGVMNVPNVESDVLNAHISVMNADEVNKIGIDKINERGHMFAYRLGSMKEIDVKNVEGVSKVWAIHVASPGLAALRKSYGLTPLPNGDHDFHITVAVRRKKVLQDNNVRKAAAVYNFKGEVQGVSLRKTLHNILDQLNKPGLAYNNARTGEARAIIAGDKKTQQEVLDALRFHLAARSHKKQLREGVDYDITPLPKQRERLHNVTMTSDDIQKFIQAQGFNRLAAESPEYQKQWINERYRLKPNGAGDLIGAVPRLAKKQLFHGEPIYDYQLEPGWQDKESTTKDLLRGGEADNVPDREFSAQKLTQGTKHEHEHTDNDQIAKEIAKDHLSEDPDYYEKVEEIEKGGRDERKGVLKDLRAAKTHSDNKRYDQKTQILRRLMTQSPHDWVIDDPKPHFKGITHVPTKFRFHAEPTSIPAGVKAAYTNPYTPYRSVYLRELLNQFNQRHPITYDHSLPVFKNIQNQLMEIKNRGDFILRTQRNYDTYRSQLDPGYRNYLAMQALHGDTHQPAFSDRMIEQYGNNFLGALGGAS